MTCPPSGTCCSCRSRRAARGVDCGTDPAVGTRFQGVRIFDISDVADPVQVAAVQTCRGSHTHTLVEDNDDPTTSTSTSPALPASGPASHAGRLQRQPGQRREPVEVAHRGDQGPARGAAERRDRQRAEPLQGRADRRDRRAPERAADAAPPVRDALGPAADHGRMPRHHRVPRRSSSPPAPARGTAC